MSKNKVILMYLLLFEFFLKLILNILINISCNKKSMKIVGLQPFYWFIYYLSSNLEGIVRELSITTLFDYFKYQNTKKLLFLL